MTNLQSFYGAGVVTRSRATTVRASGVTRSANPKPRCLRDTVSRDTSVSGRAGWGAGPQALATPAAAAETDWRPGPHVSRQVSITLTAATAADRPQTCRNAG